MRLEYDRRFYFIMIEYYKNKNLENLFYIDENGIVQEEFWGEIPKQDNKCLISCVGRSKSIKFIKSRRKNEPFIKKEKIRAVKPDKDGYLILTVRKNKKAIDIKIHQMMAIVFLNHIPNGVIDVVDHKNNVKNDNRLENLQIIKHRLNSSKDQKSFLGKTGVVSSGKKFSVNIGLKGESHYLGVLDSLEEASKLYQSAVERVNLGLSFDDLKIKQKTSTGIIGVSKKGYKYRAYTYRFGKQISIGVFLTIDEAKKAYDDYAMANPK